MNAWTELTSAKVFEAMPTDMTALYAQWVDVNQGRAARVVALTEETVAVCRAAVAARYPGLLDPDETKVPTAGIRHLLNLVIFNLGMEMGIQFAPEVFTLFQRADTWLRGLEFGTIGLAAGTEEPGPSYTVPTSQSKWQAETERELVG
jgi:hypothetical protein